MTKLERNIISALNNKESNDIVTVKNGGFFINYRGVSQNFAILYDDDHLFIRIDKNCISSYKKIFKNFTELNNEYIVCIGTSKISKMLINKYNSDDFIDDCTTLFSLYDKNMIKLLDKYNISFKDLIFNSINFFNCMEEFDEMIFDDDFWYGIERRYDYMVSWWNNININPKIYFNELEKRELSKEDWRNIIGSQRRINFIDNILEDIDK